MKLVTAATLTTLLFASTAHAWKNPTPSKTTATNHHHVVAKGLTATAAATVAVAANAAAATTTTTTIPALKMDVDAPVLFDIVKDEMNQERILFYGESIKNLFGPAFTFELPSTEFSNLKELGLQLLKGSASVIINGQTVGVQVVKSEQGALTVQLQQQYLPRIPFLGLEESTTTGGTSVVPTLVAPIPVETVTTASTATPMEQVVSTAVTTTATMTTTTTPPFWDVPLLDGALRLDVDIPFIFAVHKAITPLDVVGTTFAGLGGVYVLAFLYYSFSNWQDEQASVAKKAKMATAKKVAATKKKKAKAEADAAKQQQQLELPEEKMREDKEEDSTSKRRWLASSKK